MNRSTRDGLLILVLSTLFFASGCEPNDELAIRAGLRTPPSNSAFVDAAPGCVECRVIALAHSWLPNTRVELYAAKLYDDAGGASYEVALHPDGRVADRLTLEQTEDLEYWERYGTFDPALAREVEALPAEATIEAWVWVKTWETPQDREATLVDTLRESILSSHRDTIGLATAPIVEALTTRGATASAFVDVPVVLTRATAGQLQEATRRNPAIARVYAAPLEGTPLCTTYVQTVQADLAHASGWTGAGMSVSDKFGCQPDDYSALSVVATAKPTGCSLAHPRAVLGIMRSTVAPYGVSPAATQYMANEDPIGVGTSNLEGWLNGYGVRARNISQRYDPGGGDFAPHDRWVDYVATHYPFPVFALAAGNDGAILGDEWVRHKCYNCLTVGATDEVGTTSRSDDVIATFSSWRNPNSTFGDRELPALAAPGQGVNGAGICGSGTSLSAPMVAGAAAVMQQRNPTLLSYPEVFWALARVHANEDTDGTQLNLADGVDDHDGAGELNVYRTALYSGSSFKVDGGNPATRSAYDYGYMNYGLDFTGKYYNETWNVRGTAGCTLVASVVWDAEASCSTTSCPRPALCDCTSDNQGADLDLRLFSGSTLVATSPSFDNTYEYLRYTFPTTQTYVLKAFRWWATSNETYYAVAWHVVC